jgi:hypothetical protein
MIDTQKVRLTVDQVDAIFYIITRVCGACNDEYERQNFVYHYTKFNEGPPREWRFKGHLGFGGKLYFEYDGISVGCYAEDATPERNAIINQANALLATVWEGIESQWKL